MNPNKIQFRIKLDNLTANFTDLNGNKPLDYESNIIEHENIIRKDEEINEESR